MVGFGEDEAVEAPLGDGVVDPDTLQLRLLEMDGLVLDDVVGVCDALDDVDRLAEMLGDGEIVALGEREGVTDCDRLGDMLEEEERVALGVRDGDNEGETDGDGDGACVEYVNAATALSADTIAVPPSTMAGGDTRKLPPKTDAKSSWLAVEAIDGNLNKRNGVRHENHTDPSAAIAAPSIAAHPTDTFAITAPSDDMTASPDDVGM